MVWGFDTVEFVTKKIQTVWKIDIFTVLTFTAFYIHAVQMQKKKFLMIQCNSQDTCNSFDKFVEKQIIKILEVRIECFS